MPVWENQFQNLTRLPAKNGSFESKLRSVPPPQHFPFSRRLIAFCNSFEGRIVSASKNIRKSLSSVPVHGQTRANPARYLNEPLETAHEKW